jgi:hypothetical protein
MCAGAYIGVKFKLCMEPAMKIGFVKMGTQLHPKTTVVSGILPMKLRVDETIFVQRRK